MAALVPLSATTREMETPKAHHSPERLRWRLRRGEKKVAGQLGFDRALLSRFVGPSVLLIGTEATLGPRRARPLGTGRNAHARGR